MGIRPGRHLGPGSSNRLITHSEPDSPSSKLLLYLVVPNVEQYRFPNPHAEHRRKDASCRPWVR